MNINFNNNQNRVIINGHTYDVPNGNISIVNSKIFVDVKEFTVNGLDIKNNIPKTVNITIEGNVNSVKCNGSVIVSNGEVHKRIDCGGSVDVAGNVDGLIDCGGSVRIRGYHTGDIDAGGSVRTR
ncbi:MAG: hypothetical protein LIR50_05350 [Bacillota bacterium]|nr:hypothetical protein [Bacillota bacterium]